MMVNSERIARPRSPLARRPGRKKAVVEAVRLGISLAPAAAEWVNDEAERRGISMTDVVRRLIDEARRDYILKSKRD